MTDKRQEHLGEYSRDFAVFLPAISNFYNTFISKQRVTEGKHFFLRNYSGLSWHLRERRYLLMTKRGPVEYVFSLKHYLACFAVFLFGLCSSLTILSSFIINVIKDDIVSPAVATPIVVADFIDTRALSKNYENLQISSKWLGNVLKNFFGIKTYLLLISQQIICSRLLVSYK